MLTPLTLPNVLVLQARSAALASLAAAVVPSHKQSCRTTHEAFTRAPAASDLYDAAQLRER